MQNNTMRYKIIIFTLTLGAALLFAGNAQGQERSEMSQGERNRMDSLEAISKKEVQIEKSKDEERMAEAKSDRRKTRAKAKDAQRVERDANTAARESRSAVRSERKAQKSRRQANKQADKASKAREKSDNN
jgi:hypothetical protein